MNTWDIRVLCGNLENVRSSLKMRELGTNYNIFSEANMKKPKILRVKVESIISIVGCSIDENVQGHI